MVGNEKAAETRKLETISGRRSAPDEVLEPTYEADYLLYRSLNDLREPYRIPTEYLENTKPIMPPRLAETPLIAFINAKSGGRVGPRLAQILYRSLGQSQVFDVGEYRPRDVLKTLWSNLLSHEAQGDKSAAYIRQNLRILVAGGDGTATWVLGTIIDLQLDPPPPVAIMPLGTGNDLSLNFGWGARFEWSWVKPAHIYETLLRYKTATVHSMDCWHTCITAPDHTYYESMPHSLQQLKENPREATARFWNYFSIGLDAQAAHGFHSLRESHPRFASSRLMNQAWYGFFSCSSGWFCGAPPIATSVRLRVRPPGEDAEWKEVVVPSSVCAIVLLNVQSYGGGRDIWGLPETKNLEKKGFSEPVYNDGIIEVIGFLNGWHTAVVMGQVTSKVHAKRLAQAVDVELEIFAGRGSAVKGERGRVFMQLDGEPWRQDVPEGDARRREIGAEEPLRVSISSGGTSRMLHNSTMPLGPVKIQKLAQRGVMHAKPIE